MGERTSIGRGTRGALLVLLLLLGAPAIVQAHGDPAPLDFWGGFGARTASCQRRIGRAAARCVSEAGMARRTCRNTELDGAPCDEESTDQLVERAQIRAIGSIQESGCRSADASILGFRDVDEARSDILRTCREVVPVIESAAYRPLESNHVDALGEAERRCIAATAAAATRVLNGAVRARIEALDRIALYFIAPQHKHALVEHADTRTSSAVERLAAHLDRACTPTGFAALYGVPPERLLGAVARQADCLAGNTYAQADVVCAVPECGNGLVERGEACDDGNLTGGDGCSSDCQDG